jgi:DNA-binding NarL/FixJ family response regulator
MRQPATRALLEDNLTPSEKKIVELLALGLTNKEIANRLGLSVTTVSWHLENTYLKLYVNSRTEAALKFQASKAQAKATPETV